MARTKKAATKTTAKTASVSETPAKSVVTASEEKAVQAETPKTDDAKQLQLKRRLQEKLQQPKRQRQLQKYMSSTGAKRYILLKLLTGSKKSGQMIWVKKQQI